nr:reverse transcriptase domain-containing protein [Tanacetum cinerariifolium]
MKEMLRNCHGHNMSKGSIIKIFYHGLSEITQEVLNVTAGGSSNSDTDKIMARTDAMNLKMDAQYKELQSNAKEAKPDLEEDDIPMSCEEEAKFMQTFQIRAFSQHENETLTDAWLCMKEMLKNCHGHNLSKGNIIKIFYHGLNETTQEALNATTSARMDALTMKIDAQYKEFQSRLKQPNPDHKDDDTPMSPEEEAKFMKNFRGTCFYNDYRNRDSNRDNWRSSGRNDYNRDNYRSNFDDKPDIQKQLSDFIKAQHSTSSFVKDTFMNLKTKLETTTKNHQASIQNLKAKFDRLAAKQSGRPSGSLPSNTQPNPTCSSSKPYQPPQARNEHVNAVFTRSGKSYDLPTNPNDQQNDSETPINFDSKDEDEESTPQPKSQTPKPVKELVSNKHKLEHISAAFLSDESSAIIQNKVPSKFGDPRSLLIPCTLNKAFSCNYLAELGASINLMPYYLYAKLSFETLKPTKMSVRLADRSFQHPIEIAKNQLVEVGKFTFPVDFVILEMEEDSKVPLILVRPFLYTADAVIRVKQKQLKLGVGTKRMTFSIDSVMKHSYSNDDICLSIDVIDEILEEDFDALLNEGSKILYSIEGTILEE